MAVMIEPGKEGEMDPVAAGVEDLGTRVSVVEVKLDALDGKVDDLSSLMSEQRMELSALQRTLIPSYRVRTLP